MTKAEDTGNVDKIVEMIEQLTALELADRPLVGVQHAVSVGAVILGDR